MGKIRTVCLVALIRLGITLAAALRGEAARPVGGLTTGPWLTLVTVSPTPGFSIINPTFSVVFPTGFTFYDHNTHGRRSDDRNRLSDDGSGSHDDSDNRGADCNHGDGRGIDDRNRSRHDRGSGSHDHRRSGHFRHDGHDPRNDNGRGERLRRSGQVDHDRCDGIGCRRDRGRHMGDHLGGPEEQEENVERAGTLLSQYPVHGKCTAP